MPRSMRLKEPIKSYAQPEREQTMKARKTWKASDVRLRGFLIRLLSYIYIYEIYEIFK